MKAKKIFQYVHHFKFQIEKMVSFSKSTNVNANMSFFINSDFERNFSTYVFGKSFWHYRELKSECWISRHILCKKNFKIFSCVWRIEFRVKKWNMYEAHIYPQPLQQTFRLETTSLCLNTRLCKQTISKFTLILLILM